MTAKEYLSQAIWLNKAINAKLAQVRDIKDNLTCISSFYIADKVQTTATGDRTCDLIAKLVDLQREVLDDISRLYDIKDEIEMTIESVEDPRLRLVLFERYVNLKKWEKIAADNNYSWRSVHGHHSKGLKEVAKKMAW